MQAIFDGILFWAATLRRFPVDMVAKRTGQSAHDMNHCINLEFPWRSLKAAFTLLILYTHCSLGNKITTDEIAAKIPDFLHR